MGTLRLKQTSIKEGMDFTGLANGGNLAINANPTKYDIPEPGNSYVVDKSDPDNPVRTEVTWDPKLELTTPFLTSHAGTFVGLDGGGAVVMQVTDFSPTQMANSITRIGRLSHFNRSTITGRFFYPARYLSANIDWINSIIQKGTVNESGNIFSANGANLRLNKTVGLSSRIGANYETDKNNPNMPTTPAVSEIEYLRIYRGASNSTITSTTLSVSSLTRSGTTVTATTTTPHKIFADTRIVIADADQSEYNGSFIITGTPSTTTFTYEIVGTPVTPATGTITATYVVVFDLDPNFYDDGSTVLVEVPPNKWTIQQTILFPNNEKYTVMIAYGQAIYNSFTDGMTAILSYNAVINEDVAGASDRALILIEEGTTNLAEALENKTAYIRTLSGAGGASGGGGATSFTGLTDVEIINYAAAGSILTVNDTKNGVIESSGILKEDGVLNITNAVGVNESSSLCKNTARRSVFRIEGSSVGDPANVVGMMVIRDSDTTKEVNLAYTAGTTDSVTMLIDGANRFHFDGKGTLTFSDLSLQSPGIAQANKNYITIDNLIEAADITNTSNTILFRQKLPAPAGYIEQGSFSFSTLNNWINDGNQEGGASLDVIRDGAMQNAFSIGKNFPHYPEKNLLKVSDDLSVGNNTGKTPLYLSNGHTDDTINIDAGTTSFNATSSCSINQNLSTMAHVAFLSLACGEIYNCSTIDSAGGALSLNGTSSQNVILGAGGGHVEVEDIRGIGTGDIIFKDNTGNSIISILNDDLDVIAEMFWSLHGHTVTPTPAINYCSLYFNSTTGDVKITKNFGGVTTTTVIA